MLRGGVGDGNGVPVMEDLGFLPGTVFMWIGEPQVLELRGTSQPSSPSCVIGGETEAPINQVTFMRGGGLA